MKQLFSSVGGLFAAVFAALAAVWAKPDRALMSCAIAASVVSVVYFSGDKAHEFWPRVILVGLGLAAVGFHIRGAQNACSAWFDRSLPRFLGWAFVALCAFGWEINSQLAISSNNQGQLAETQKAAHQEARAVSSRFDLAKERAGEAARNLELARKAMWDAAPMVDGKPVNTKAEVDALVAGMKAQTLNWDQTEGCTKTNGPKTRAFCKSYAEAMAAYPALATRKALEENVTAAVADDKSAKDEFSAALASQGKTKFASSGQRADTRNFIRAANFAGYKPGEEDVELIQSLLLPFTLGVFLFIASWLMKAEEYAGRAPRPWINWGRIFSTLWHGKAATEKRYLGAGKVVIPA